MALDVFSPPRGVSPSSGSTAKPRIKLAQFGDGYSQRAGDGLNAVPRTFQAQWDAISSDDADSIEAFMTAHVATPFSWMPPLETVARKWIAGEQKRGYLGADTVSLSVQLTEVFDL